MNTNNSESALFQIASSQAAILPLFRPNMPGLAIKTISIMFDQEIGYVNGGEFIGCLGFRFSEDAQLFTMGILGH